MASSAKSPILGSFLEGWRRVIAAPALSASLLVLTLAIALPLGRALGGMLQESLGSSLVAEKAAWNWDASWAAEFAAQAQGLGKTFTHEIIGFGGTLKILSGIADNQPLNTTLAGAVAAYSVLWLFLTGGILDRLARGRAVRAAGFFAACGGYFGRMLRLFVVMGATYWALFKWLHPFLLTRVYDHYTRDVTSERDGLIVRVLLYLAFGLALFVANLIFDYAKVRLVVEDRRSVIGALGASMRFLRRRPLRAFGLYLLNGVAFLMVLRVWLGAAPQAWDSVAWAFLVTQVYLLVRIWLRLAFLSSEIVFFQGELAHAGYTARPPHVWPNSAAAEAIENLRT
ncbi:MAG: hypothetical protein EPO35_12445 [Acidobacteria bacterium]|nr:MAG: hypothetical protein EPO35_12445 [Acidobacteriota bacterium]